MSRVAFALGLAWACLLAPTAEAAGTDPLVAAAEAGDVATLRRLIREGHDANAAGTDGATALHWMVRAEDEGAVAASAVRQGHAHVEPAAAMLKTLDAPLDSFGDSTAVLEI